MWAPLIISKVDKIHELVAQRDEKEEDFKRAQRVYKRLVENEYSVYVEVNYKRSSTKEERFDQVRFDIMPSKPGTGDNIKKALLLDVQEQLKKLREEINALQDEINAICIELEGNTPEVVWED